jgi:hypothetical protein
MTELIIDVLRDSEHSPSFAWLADPATRALRDNPDLDFSIEHFNEAAPVAVVAALDAVRAHPAADVEVDPLQALRDVVEQLEHHVPVSMPSTSRRAKKRMKQQQRRQVRVAAVTVGLLRNVGALPAPAVVPAPVPQPSYSASLMSGGSVVG